MVYIEISYVFMTKCLLLELEENGKKSDWDISWMWCLSIWRPANNNMTCTVVRLTVSFPFIPICNLDVFISNKYISWLLSALRSNHRRNLIQITRTKYFHSHCVTSWVIISHNLLFIEKQSKFVRIVSWILILPI